MLIQKLKSMYYTSIIIVSTLTCKLFFLSYVLVLFAFISCLTSNYDIMTREREKGPVVCNTFALVLCLKKY